LRAKWLLAWMLALSGFGALFGLAGVSKIAEQSPSVGQGFGILAAGCAGGWAVGLLLSVAAYFIFSHWLARRMARGLEVSVEALFCGFANRRWCAPIGSCTFARSSITRPCRAA